LATFSKDYALRSGTLAKPHRKIDYIFVSHDIEIISADIPAIVASDHRPHIAEVHF
jgi:endonuclease/exonuclease/phosphatase (EEP) superfamily protein YafD